MGPALGQATYSHAEQPVKLPVDTVASDVKATKAEIAEKDALLERRAAVRAALTLREQKNNGREETPKAKHQLTAQQRYELRQQLRHQRNDGANP